MSPNERVREVMQSCDVLAEQFIATGYALNAIERLASRLPALANLEHEAYTRAFRRYGFLDECPILPATPETLTDQLRLLVTKPDLRRTLGRAGPQFAEKCHSYRTARYVFGTIHDVLLERSQHDLIKLIHPLKSSYNRAAPRVDHPLVNSLLPVEHASAQGRLS